MKQRKLFKIMIFIALLLPATTVINGLAWGFDPPGDDTTPPTASWVNPASGATVSGTSVLMKVSASDADSGVAFVDFYIGSSYLGRVYSGTNYYVKYLNSKNYNNGGYSLKAWVIDNNGNYISKYRSITISNYESIAPSVSIDSPADGDTINRDVTITTTATDANSQIKYVKFYIDGTYIGTHDTKIGNQYKKTFDSWEYTSGSHQIKAVAYDTFDNTDEDIIDITIDNDPVKLSYPTTGITWHTDAARHPTNTIVYNIARKAAGYGMRKLLDEGTITDGNTRYNIVMGLARFAKDWLTPKWSGDGDTKSDLTVAGEFSGFDSSMEYGAIGTCNFDCRDISAFLTGMAMAMGIEAKMLSCEYGTESNSAKHVAALLKRGSSDWFLISVFNTYVDSNSDDEYVYGHLNGGTTLNNNAQYVFHFTYYVDVWESTIPDFDLYLDEVGWVGWVIFNPDITKTYQAPNFMIGGLRVDFIEWDDNPWDIDVSDSRTDAYDVANANGDI